MKLSVIGMLFPLLFLGACSEPAVSHDVLGTADVAEETLEVSEPAPYLFVRIDDVSNGSYWSKLGVRLDAVLLEKQDGRVLFAESVVDSSIPALEGNEVADVLGPPDSVPNYRSPEQPVCDMENGTLALLGSGFVVVKMPEPIEVGDCVAIIDVGECDFPYGQVSIEPMYAQVSVAPTPDNSYWVTPGQGAGVYVSLSVTSLPDLRE